MDDFDLRLIIPFFLFRFANNYICALTETVKSIDTGLPPNLPVTIAISFHEIFGCQEHDQ